MIRRAPSIFLILVLSITIILLAAVEAALVIPAAAAPLAQAATPMPAAQATALSTRTQAAPPAASPAASTSPTARRPDQSLSNQECLDCHSQGIKPYLLQNGDPLELVIEPKWHQSSVHGQAGIRCVQCHPGVGEYPHPAWQAADRRDVTLQLNQVCTNCHQQQAAMGKDDIHAAAQKAGIRQAAVCVDCHTAHEVRRLTDPQTHKLLPESRQWTPQRCALCHNAIFQKYQASVHGAALLKDNNPDVPTCVDCHSVHNISDPNTSYFRLRSPEICAKCHTDAKIMDKYGIHTDVLNTYVADFHGTTVAIFEKVSPDAPVNKAVCYDCHGIHDIARVDDPQKGLEIKQNLLARCKICHPNASADFPDAWLSHYTPSSTKYPVVYYVNLFYKFFIPGVLLPMALLVVADMARGRSNRKRSSGHTSSGAGAAEVFDAPDKEARV